MKLKTLGELEFQIMDIIWARGQSSINYVFNVLKKDRTIAYTTVATIFQRLYNKGFLKKSHYKYEPKLPRENYSKGFVQNFFNQVLDKFGDIAIVSFAESLDSLPKKKRDYLLKLLNEKK